MVFRKESRADSFQRQISALRQQLGADQDEDEVYDDAEPMPEAPDAPPAESPILARPVSSPVTRAATPRPVDATTGVIAAGSLWNGTMQTEGSLQVFGTVEGELSANEEIYIAEGAQVNARLRARIIVVAGTVDGTIQCGGKLEVLSTGRVSGEVTTPSLVVQEGATVEGDLRMQPPEPVE